MLFPIAFATVWGATIVPLVMLVLLAFERLQAARRLARLDPDAPYETRLQAEHEARQSRSVPTRHIEWRDFASPRAVVPATLALLLALTPPLVEGWSDVGLLIGAIGSVTWWSHLQRSGVKYGSVYASLIWALPAIVWIAMMLGTAGAYPVGDYTPWHYTIWDLALPDPVVPVLASVLYLSLMPLAFYCTLRRGLSRFAIVLTVGAVIPLATVVLAGSLLGPAQAALAVAMIGYIMSKSRRRLSDTATARARVDAAVPRETETGSARHQFNRGDIIIGVALVMATVIAMNALQVFLDIAIFDGAWQTRVMLVATFALVSVLAFMRRGWRDALWVGTIITVAAVFALSLQTVGSWLLTPLTSPESSSDVFAGSRIIYAQVNVLALVGLAVFIWAIARRKSAEYGAMSIGFAWPLIMAGMLGTQLFYGINSLTVQTWIPVAMAAPLVIATMWFVSGSESE